MDMNTEAQSPKPSILLSDSYLRSWREHQRPMARTLDKKKQGLEISRSFGPREYCEASDQSDAIDITSPSQSGRQGLPGSGDGTGRALRSVRVKSTLFVLFTAFH